MSKYIIEIEDRPFKNVDGSKKLYRAKGFNTLVFDELGLSKLEKYEPDKPHITIRLVPGDVVININNGRKAVLISETDFERDTWLVTYIDNLTRGYIPEGEMEYVSR